MSITLRPRPNPDRLEQLIRLPDEVVVSIARYAGWISDQPGNPGYVTLEELIREIPLDPGRAYLATLAHMRTCLALDCDDELGCNCAAVHREIDRRSESGCGERTRHVWDGLFMEQILDHIRLVGDRLPIHIMTS